MESLGQRLNFCREHAGLSLAELARLIGEPEQILASFENATATPNPAVLFALSDALHVDARWLSLGVASGHEPQYSPLVNRIAQAIALLTPDKRDSLAALLGVTLID